MTLRAKVFGLILLMAIFAGACNLTSAPEEQLLESTDVPTNITVPPTRTLPATAGLPTRLPLTPLFVPTARPGQLPPTSGVLPPTQVVLASTPLPVSIVILSPIPGNVVAGNVQVLGAAIHPQFLQYHLEYGPDPNPGNLWFPATGAIQNPVLNGLLGIWNTTAVQDGLYQLRLRLVLRDGTGLATVVNNIRIQNRVPTPVPSATPNIPRPIAAFTQDVAAGQVPLTVRFTNQSVGTITSYRWDFGDGTFSQEASPTHIFNSTGIFNVILTVSGPGGSSNVSRQINAQSPSAPIAGFTQDKTRGPSPLTVQFTDQSTGNVSSYNWNFGDGTTSAERNPSHTFTAVGTYNVILTVTGPGGSSIVTRQIVVDNPLTATPTPITPSATFTPSATASVAPTNTSLPTDVPQPAQPVAAFTADPNSGTAPLTVQFTDQSTGEITSWFWDFSDNNTSNEQNPSHIFQAAGNYVVRLTVFGPGGEDTEETTISIGEAFEPPNAAFAAEPTSGSAPLAVQFTDQSSGDIASWQWNFGDGGASNEQSPSYTFNTPGDWVVNLTVTGTDGVSTSSSEATISVAPAGPPPDSSRIVFTTDRDGNSEIYVMNADGTNVQNLTDNPSGDSEPAWSPDGSQVAFVSDRDGFGYLQIYTMYADGSNASRISDTTAGDYSPAWSPNGQIAFVSERDGFPQIYVMNSEGSGLTKISDGNSSDYAPVWASDGSRLAFVSERDGFPQIYVMNSDGSGVTRVSDGNGSDYAPAWSPDGNRLTFTSEGDGNPELYIMNADGTNVVRLTTNGANDSEPHWTS
jgi:PKD repeat protein